MGKRKRNTVDEATHKRMLIESAIKDIEKDVAKGLINKPPKHRIFKVGDRVLFGAHKESYIRKIYRDGLYYEVECLNVKRSRDIPAANETHVVRWHSLYKYVFNITNLRKEETFRINMISSCVGSLLHLIERGIDFDVEYQREHVWKRKDKIALIDSIFNNVDIGKFVFVQRDFSYESRQLEVLDGKQRLTAINEFYEDRFKYKGYYYSELGQRDKNKFEEHPISYGYLENPDKKSIFEAFIKLNTSGKSITTKHIDKVKKLLDEIEKEEEKYS